MLRTKPKILGHVTVIIIVATSVFLHATSHSSRIETGEKLPVSSNKKARNEEICIEGERMSPKPCFQCVCGVVRIKNYRPGWMCTVNETCLRDEKIKDMDFSDRDSDPYELEFESGASVVKFREEVCMKGYSFEVNKCKTCVCSGNGLYECSNICFTAKPVKEPSGGVNKFPPTPGLRPPKPSRPTQSISNFPTSPPVKKNPRPGSWNNGDSLRPPKPSRPTQSASEFPPPKKKPGPGSWDSGDFDFDNNDGWGSDPPGQGWTPSTIPPPTSTQSHASWDWGQIFYKPGETIANPVQKTCQFGICSKSNINND